MTVVVEEGVEGLLQVLRSHLNVLVALVGVGAEWMLHTGRSFVSDAEIDKSFPLSYAGADCWGWL